MELNGVEYHYQVIAPGEKALLPFIEKYIHFSTASGTSFQKYLWPDPHVTVIFNFRSTSLNNKKCPGVTVIGLHEAIHLMEPEGSKIDTIIVHFTSLGFGLFSNTPASYLTGLCCDARDIFGDAVETLFNTMKPVDDIQFRTTLLDAFFSSRLKMQNTRLSYIAEVTKNLLRNPDLSIPETGILSYRHFSRLFKQAVGVNLQTFRRLSRFEIAKKLLFQELDISLADISYRAGYYDQAHFAREFKKLSGLNAKKFGPLCSI